MNIHKTLSFSQCGPEQQSSSSTSSGSSSESRPNGDARSLQRKSLVDFSFIKVLGKGSFGKVSDLPPD